MPYPNHRRVGQRRPDIQISLDRLTGIPRNISLGDTGNTPTRSVFVFFTVVVVVALFVGTECPVGGGCVGYVRKALKKGYLEHPGFACCNYGMFEIFGRLGQCVTFFAALFCQQFHAMSAYIHHRDQKQNPVLIRPQDEVVGFWLHP